MRYVTGWCVKKCRLFALAVMYSLVVVVVPLPATSHAGDVPAAMRRQWIEISIDGHGAYLWRDATPMSEERIKVQMTLLAMLSPQPKMIVDLKADWRLPAVRDAIDVLLKDAEHVGFVDVYVRPNAATGSENSPPGDNAVHYQFATIPRAVLLVTVDANGCASDVRIRSTSETFDLDAAAVEAAKHWAYAPSSEGGGASASSEIAVPVDFVPQYAGMKASEVFLKPVRNPAPQAVGQARCR
jgi:TonB family protein